jgi:RimJ/RimL family protein N-acetyltransferase
MPLRWPIARRLQSERLILEPLRVDHAEEMLAVLAEPSLYAHTGGEPPSLAEVRERYARQATGSSPGGTEGWLNWVLRRREGGRLVGFVQATLNGEPPSLSAELAWLVAADEQGAGLATEAATTVVEWLPTVRVGDLTAYIHPDNVGSAVVARRLGMTPTGPVRDGETRWQRRRDLGR